MVAGLRDLGIGDALAGDTELALSRWREALALAREHDLHGYLPGLTGNLAAAELQRRNWSAARTLAAEAAEFADRSGDAQASAISRLNEGTATILGGEPAAARRPLVEALEISVARGWTMVAHEVLDALAAVVTAEGDPERAARLMGAAQALREDGSLASEKIEEEHRRTTRARLRETLGEQKRREADEVCEDNRDPPPLAALNRRHLGHDPCILERRAAGAAEAEPGRALGPTGRTRRSERGAARAAEADSGGILEGTRRATHSQIESDFGRFD